MEFKDTGTILSMNHTIELLSMQREAYTSAVTKKTREKNQKILEEKAYFALNSKELVDYLNANYHNEPANIEDLVVVLEDGTIKTIYADTCCDLYKNHDDRFIIDLSDSGYVGFINLETGYFETCTYGCPTVYPKVVGIREINIRDKWN